MRLFALLVVLVVLAGCGGGTYHLSKDDYRQRVKTLGVVPILVDKSSTIQHPQRSAVLGLLAQHSQGKEERLVEVLREAKAYFDIRPVAGSGELFYASLVAGSEVVSEGDKLYRRYRFNPDGVTVLCRDHVVDGLLVVLLYGAEKVEARRDRNLVDYLEARYNSIQVQALVVLPDGSVAWEYPGQGGEKFLDLQFADFDEAYYNKTDQVAIKFITVPGLDRTLGEQAGGFFSKEEFPKPYHAFFERLVKALKPGWLPFL